MRPVRAAAALRELAVKKGYASPRELISKSSKWRTWLAENLSPTQSKELIDSWAFNARHNQVMPEGHWRLWLCWTGKGWGKNRVMNEFIHEKAAAHPDFAGFIAARTTADVKKTIIGDTESGLLVTQRPGNPCEFKTHPTERVVWANGAHADIHTSEEPDRARGKNYLYGIADEVAAWSNKVDLEGNTCFTNLDFSLRAGKRKNLIPQWVVGTTPRPTKTMRELFEDVNGDSLCRLSTGTMMDNEANLAEGYIAAKRKKYEGTRLWRQEALGELLMDIEDAVITTEMLDASRIQNPEDVPFPAGLPDMVRVVVAVDPALSFNKKSDWTGINVTGLGVDEEIYSLADLTCKMSVDGWTRRVADAVHKYEANYVIAESNVIGKAIENLIQAHDRHIHVKTLPATRAKHVRAYPVLQKHEQGKAHIVGNQPGLEDQLVQFTPGGWVGDGSPDNADAYAWGANEFLTGHETSWADVIEYNQAAG